MLNQFSRTQLLLGADNMDRLADAKVAVFGIGGVGGYVVEALARSGVGSFVLVDDDKVCLTNINRQIIATRKTVGKYKVDVMKDRILEINPDADVEIRKCFYLPENAHEFPFEEYSYVVDAVDTVTAKIEIIMRAKAADVPVISCMGAGNKLDASAFQVADIYKTKMCPLAKVMRRELKARGIKKSKSCIFGRKTGTSIRRYEHQLQTALCMPTGDRKKMYPEKRYSGKYCIRSIRSRPDPCRRSGKRPDHQSVWTGNGIMGDIF